jgi:H-type lectin domain
MSKKALNLLCCFLTLALAINQNALGQDFHPTMVETGLVNTDSHITFNPPFPNAPTVVFAVTRVRVLDATSGCSPTVKNVTNTGFDYVSNCTAGLKYASTWIATLQQ